MWRGHSWYLCVRVYVCLCYSAMDIVHRNRALFPWVDSVHFVLFSLWCQQSPISDKQNLFRGQTWLLDVYLAYISYAPTKYFVSVVGTQVTLFTFTASVRNCPEYLRKGGTFITFSLFAMQRNLNDHKSTFDLGFQQKIQNTFLAFYHLKQSTMSLGT